MGKARNYYEALGVGRDADREEIRRAFRQKAKEHHPDTQSTGSVESFRLAQEAYETLCDDSARRRYDRELEQSEAGLGGSPFGSGRHRTSAGFDSTERAFSNLWDLFMAAAAASDRPASEPKFREKRSREPIDYTVHLSSLEAVTGTRVTLPHEGRRPLVAHVPPGVYHGQVITVEFEDLFGRREIHLHMDIRG